ncbi:hypothetical protein ACFPFP_22335 [Bradyrhizobium sp. GCM10023182]|uniref:HEPN domain-containing protein n=1 Tax=Bradyrhizobium zhengyangense TaxID=2911009 RepID=A0ABS9LRP3_9BRAD|nr:hypothetical protein [Bradyrhizobium zhengyangense]MCG2642697.1 hypothetical protein [Bradyrhizobium zhengyangense]MCG2669695.1 hypothetical protein [Bradyrhizobium zhengyangense]
MEVTIGSSDLTDYARQRIALALYAKGQSFLGASILLQDHGGDEYVVLHLVCQGTEIIAKALLLLLDYKKYDKVIRGYGHDLEGVALAALKVFGLQPMRPALAQEVKALNVFYKGNLLRYNGLPDIFIDPKTIDRQRLLRRTTAVVRLANREIAKLAQP